MTTLPKTADITIDHRAVPWTEVFLTIAAWVSRRDLPAPTNVAIISGGDHPHVALTFDAIAAAERWADVLGGPLYDVLRGRYYSDGAPYRVSDHRLLGWHVSVTGSDRPAHRLVAAAVLTPDASDLPAEAVSGVSDRG